MSRYRISRLALSFVLITNTIGAFAQTNNIKAASPDSAYAQDSSGNVIRSEFGLCWRTGEWTDSNAITGCDGQLAPPLALKVTAPEVPGSLSPVPVTVPAVVAASPCDTSITLSNEQTFEFNKAELTPAAKQHIKGVVVSRLDKCSRIDIILVTGHADKLGSTAYNRKLSERRAAAVAAYLQSQGVTVPIQASGAGSTQPIKSCNKKLSRKKLIDCLAPNRRVTIVARSPD